MSENMKIKVFYVESIDPYRETSVVGSQGFFDESQAEALQMEKQEKNYPNYSYMVQEIYAEFAHRNGETQNPDRDQEGHYWKHIEVTPDVKFFVVDEWRKGRWHNWENTNQVVPIYGPIPMPQPV